MKPTRSVFRYKFKSILSTALLVTGCGGDSPVSVSPVSQFLSEGERTFSATSPGCSVEGKLEVAAKGQAVARLVLRRSSGTVTSSQTERAVLSTDGDRLTLEFLDNNIAGAQKIVGRYVAGPPEHVEGDGFVCSLTSGGTSTVTLSWRLQ